jgi:hypothetical protein
MKSLQESDGRPDRCTQRPPACETRRLDRTPVLCFAGKKVDNAAVEDRLGTAVVESGQRRMASFPYGELRGCTANDKDRALAIYSRLSYTAPPCLNGGGQARMRARAAIVLVALVSAVGAAERHPANAASAEQVAFSAEDRSVTRPIGIPDDIAAILRNDAGVRRALEAEHRSADKLPPAWFMASAVHLGGPGEEDIIVVAIGPLRGANIATFWLFRPASRGHELLLTVSEHDLVVTNKRWRGYRIVETASMTAALIHTAWYRFDGRQYRGFKETGWEDIGGVVNQAAGKPR